MRASPVKKDQRAGEEPESHAAFPAGLVERLLNELERHSTDQHTAAEGHDQAERSLSLTCRPSATAPPAICVAAARNPQAKDANIAVQGSSTARQATSPDAGEALGQALDERRDCAPHAFIRLG